jgi:hypothetical protein
MSIKREPRIYPVSKPADWAGRLDIIAECEGEWEGAVLSGNYVLDWKSSKKPATADGYPEWKLQVSTYLAGAVIQGATESDSGCAVIRLDKFDGTPSIYDYSSGWQESYVAFGHLLRYYRTAYPKDFDKGVPSVTTILGLLAKPALIQWAANCSRDWILDRVAEHCKPFLDGGGEPHITLANVTEWAEEAPKNFRKVGKVATDIGTEVHKYIEIDLKKKDTKINWNHVCIATEKAYEAYLKFKKAVQLKPKHIELKVVGKL